jgi:hypothetical protein
MHSRDERQIKQHEAAECDQQLGQKWTTLEMSKQDQFVGNILRRVTMGHAAVWIEIDKTRLLATLLARKPEVPCRSQRDKPEILELADDFQAVRRGAEVHVIVPTMTHVSREIA